MFKQIIIETNDAVINVKKKNESENENGKKQIEFDVINKKIKRS